VGSESLAAEGDVTTSCFSPPGPEEPAVTADSNDSQKQGSLPNAECGLNAIGPEACAARYFFIVRMRPPVPGEASMGINCKLPFTSPDAESVTAVALCKLNTRTINTLAAGALAAGEKTIADRFPKG
jgi:hypothetical protein